MPAAPVASGHSRRHRRRMCTFHAVSCRAAAHLCARVQLLTSAAFSRDSSPSLASGGRDCLGLRAYRMFIDESSAVIISSHHQQSCGGPAAAQQAFRAGGGCGKHLWRVESGSSGSDLESGNQAAWLPTHSPAEALELRMRCRPAATQHACEMGAPAAAKHCYSSVCVHWMNLAAPAGAAGAPLARGAAVQASACV